MSANYNNSLYLFSLTGPINFKLNIKMKQFLLLDSTGNIIKPFNDYKSANHYRNMYNRPDWSIKIK